jgi:hypothetical protein
MGVKRNAHTILVGEPEGKRPFSRPLHTWEDNTERNFKEIGHENVDYTHLSQGRGPEAGSCKQSNEPCS